MRYAITFTTDPHDSWASTDTIIVEVDDYREEGGNRWYDDKDKLVEVVRKYVNAGEDTYIDPHYIFVRNVDDIDITINNNGEVQ